MNRDNNSSGVPKFSDSNNLQRKLDVLDTFDNGAISVTSKPIVALPRDRQGNIAPMQIYIEWNDKWSEWVGALGDTINATGDVIDQTGYYLFLPNSDKTSYTIRRFIG